MRRSLIFLLKIIIMIALVGFLCKTNNHCGRNFIGIEISEKYCEIARQRVAATPSPLISGYLHS